MSMIDDTTPTRVTVDRSPAKVSATGATIAGAVAALTTAPFALLALPLGLGGVAMIAGGLWATTSRRLVSLGTASLFLGVLVAGGFGTPVEFLLIATIGVGMAWDLGHNAIGLGEQMGRHSKTRRSEVIHAGATLIVVLAASVIGYSAYLVGGGGHPVAALAGMSLGLVFMIWAIRI
ncbi:hypothetical protein OB955_15120 [Halobacteria archaeon AArc-m2/3/4]|uniref:Uncharacterized protein n=1 Tax=Natronoglomus mannanivorans TaxID=2979990 RepID=A0AAP2Z3T6_9EURY|nr:hypothetical protein [Halobacteria archaeon AArc-xg1-1]MCU4974059.1 hypothetical protein [Halobacteria archaeon AArc-m2/3/4]